MVLICTDENGIASVLSLWVTVRPDLNVLAENLFSWMTMKFGGVGSLTNFEQVLLWQLEQFLSIP